MNQDLHSTPFLVATNPFLFARYIREMLEALSPVSVAHIAFVATPFCLDSSAPTKPPARILLVSFQGLRRITVSDGSRDLHNLSCQKNFNIVIVSEITWVAGFHCCWNLLPLIPFDFSHYFFFRFNSSAVSSRTQQFHGLHVPEQLVYSLSSFEGVGFCAIQKLT